MSRKIFWLNTVLIFTILGEIKMLTVFAWAGFGLSILVLILMTCDGNPIFIGMADARRREIQTRLDQAANIENIHPCS